MKWNVFLLVFILSACSNNKVRIPSEIFSKEKMVDILIDIHLSDSLSGSERIEDANVLDNVKKAYFVSVLEKHNISEEEFRKSYDFYENHPEIFHEIYETILIEIIKRDAELNGVNELDIQEPESTESEEDQFNEENLDENEQ